MSTSIVTASVQLNDGSTVDLYTSMTESTTGLSTSELQTSTKYAVSATSIGTFANGKTITAITQPVTGTNNISFAYLERRGTIIQVLPCATRGVQSSPSVPWVATQLAAGDTIQVCSVATATRAASYSVITDKGVQAIFGGLDASGDVELVHILSGQGIGSSLTGQKIVRHMGAQCAASSAKNTSGGLYVINDRGIPAGACCLTVMASTQQVPNAMAGALVGLNYVARVTSSS